MIIALVNKKQQFVFAMCHKGHLSAFIFSKFIVKTLPRRQKCSYSQFQNKKRGNTEINSVLPLFLYLSPLCNNAKGTFSVSLFYCCNEFFKCLCQSRA